MPFARQVTIGRVALVQFPEAEAGKLVVISDIVSPNAVSASLQPAAPRRSCTGAAAVLLAALQQRSGEHGGVAEDGRSALPAVSACWAGGGGRKRWRRRRRHGVEQFLWRRQSASCSLLFVGEILQPGEA